MSTFTTQADPERIEPGCAWLTVNRACNFRCSWCYAQGTEFDAGKSMSFDLADKLLALLFTLGIKRVTVIGGEPTLWEPLLDFNKLCVDRKIKTTLVTNAARFGIDKFWECYQACPNTKAGVSIKAANSFALERVAKVKIFDLTEKGLRRALNFFKCGVSTVYNTACVGDVVGIAQFAMDCGARCLSISPCTPAFCGGKPDGTYVVEPQTVVRDIVEMYPRLQEITGGQLTFSMKLPLCLWPRDFMEMLIERNQVSTVCQLQHRTGLIFDVDGRLAICNSLFDYSIGKFGENFRDKDSLITLLNSERVRILYDKLTSYASTKCIGCEKFEVCAGGCPLFWSLYHPEELIPGW